jgi:uroporphyrinogen decarboxylase
LQETPEQVYQEAKKCIEIANGNGGFILNPGCEVPADTPSENILAMVKAAIGSESKG